MDRSSRLMWTHVVVAAAITAGIGAHLSEGYTPLRHREFLAARTAESTLALVRRGEALVSAARTEHERHPGDWDKAFQLADRLWWQRQYLDDLEQMLGARARSMAFEINLDEVRRLAELSSRLAQTPQQAEWSRILNKRVRDVLETQS